MAAGDPAGPRSDPTAAAARTACPSAVIRRSPTVTRPTPGVVRPTPVAVPPTSPAMRVHSFAVRLAPRDPADSPA